MILKLFEFEHPGIMVYVVTDLAEVRILSRDHFIFIIMEINEDE